jgi:hypothetical protein
LSTYYHPALDSRPSHLSPDQGEWKYLRKTAHEVAPESAIRAFIELASHLRLLDDQKDLSGFFQQANAAVGTRNKTARAT